MTTEHTEEQASLYVLGLLPLDEARSFEVEIASDPEVAALVAHLETGAAALAFTTQPLDPPPALRARIAADIERDDPSPAGRPIPFPRALSWLPWAAVACLTLLTVRLAYSRYHLHLLVDSFLNRDRIQQRAFDHLQAQRLNLENRLDTALARLASDAQQATATQSELDSLRAQLADLNTRDTLSQIKIATLASMLKNAPQARAIVAWDPVSQRGILQPENIPAATPDKDYQLWIIDPGYKTPVSAGVFDPGQRADFHPLHPISKAGKFAISLENKGGSPTPQGPIVLIGQ